MNTRGETRFKPFHRRWLAGQLLTAIAVSPVASLHAAEDAPKPAEQNSAAIEIADVKRDGPVDFGKDILPILRQNCIACHNAKDHEADLVLETPEAIRKGGESGPAVVPGKAAESLLLRVSAKLEKPVMPPKTNKVGANPLTPQELGLIKLWIDQGAKGDAPAASATTAPAVWHPLPEGLNPIYAVAVTDDGQLAACNRANQIFIYNLPRRSLLTRLTDPALLASVGAGRPGVAHRDLVQSLAFSPDGKLLASGGFREVKLWQRPDPVVRLSLAGVAANRVAALAVSSDGKILAAASDDGAIRLFSLPDGKPRAELKGHAGEVVDLRFSADGAKLFSGSSDKTIRVWNVADGAAVGRIDTPQAVSAVLVAQSKETGERIISAGGDNLIRMWSMPTPALAVGADVPGPITALAAAPDRKRVAVAGADRAIRIIEVDTGKAGPAMTAHAGPIRVIDFDGSGKQVISASDDGTAMVSTVADGKPVLTMTDPGGAIAAAAIRPDGKQAATAVGDGRVTLWRLDSPAPRPLGAADETAATVGVVSPNNQLLATAGTSDGKPAVLVRNIASGQITHKLLGAEGPITSVAFSADGNRVAAGSADKTARVWTIADGKEVAKFPGHAQPVTAITFHSDNARVVSAAADGTVKLWNVSDAKEVRSFPAHAALVIGVAILPKDQLVTASADQTFNLFDLNTGQPVRSTLLATPATALAASRDGARLALATADGKIRLISAADGTEQKTLASPTPITVLSFSADGKRLVATGGNRAIVYQNDPGVPVETIAGAGVTLAAFADNGEEVLVARDDKTIHATPLRFATTLPGVPKKVTRLRYANDGSLVVAASEDGVVRAFNSADGTLKYTSLHGSPVRDLAISPDGALLASGGDDRLIKLWATTTGAPAAPTPQLGPFAAPLASVAFSADGKRVIGASTKADDAWVFDREQAAPLESIFGNGQALLALAALDAPKDGGDVILTVSATAEKPIAVNKTSSRGQLAGHTGVVTSLAAVPGDAGRFVSGSADGTARQWVLNTGTAERQFAHGGPVSAVAVRADGKVVASVGATFAKLFDAQSGKETAALRGDRFANELAQFTERRLALAQAEVTFRNQKLAEATAQQAAEAQAIAKATEAKTAADKSLADKQAIATAKAAAKAAADAALAEAVAAIDAATKAQAAADQQVPATKQLADAAAAKQAEVAAVAQNRAAEALPSSQAALQAKSVLDAVTADAAANTKAAADAKAASDGAPAASPAADKAATDAKAAAEKEAANAALQDAAVAATRVSGDAAAKAKSTAEALPAAQKAADDATAATKAPADAHAVAQKVADEIAIPAKLATITLDSAQKRTADATTAAQQAVQAKTAADQALAAAKAKQPEADQKAKQAATEAAQANTELATAAQAAASLAKSIAETQAAAVRTEQDLADRKVAHAVAQAAASKAQVELESARKSAAASEKPVGCISFTPDGSTVVAAGQDGAVRTYSADTGVACEVLRTQDGAAVSAIAVAPDGSILAGGADRTVRSWDVNPPWTLKATLGAGDSDSSLADRVLGLAFSPDGALLATAGGVPTRSGELKLWSVATGQLFRQFPEAHSDAVYGLGFSGDGKLLASGGADKFARVWNVQTGTLRRSFEGHTGHVLDVSLRHDGRVLVTGGADSTIKVWDLITGEQRPLNNPQPSKLEVTSVAHVGFTDRFLVTTGDGAMRLVREDLNVERNFDNPPVGTFLHAGAATPDGVTVLTGGYDSILRVRDARDGKVLADLSPPAAK